jgi:D-aminopeptidase
LNDHEVTFLALVVARLKVATKRVMLLFDNELSLIMSPTGRSKGEFPHMRARDLGIIIGSGTPGPHNAITDVPGVRVGHTTLIEGDGPLVVGEGPVRTGVTVIVPSVDVGRTPLFAGCHRLNGNGEFTGLEWIRESGMLMSPIAITNTHSVGVVRDSLISAQVRSRPAGEVYWSLSVVGETWDGILNDTSGMHVRPEHLWNALETASSGSVAEGNVGGGTGMICHEFKGGIGTASRVTASGYTVGVLVQANYGRRERLTVAGIPVGRLIPTSEIPAPGPGPSAPGFGSIIVVVATDAPLLANQCARLAQRAGLGIARVGGVGDHTSGDIFLCFATGNTRLSADERVTQPLNVDVSMVHDTHITPLYDAVVDATEESILNALVAAETMTGRDGITAHALPVDRLIDAMTSYRWTTSENT